MSHAKADSLTKRVTSTTLHIVWSQWRALGARLSASHQPDPNTPVDPEALLLGSLALVEEEPRLRDVVAAWMTERSARLSMQRVRNLARRFPDEVRPKLAAAAATAVEKGRDARWKPLAKDAVPLGAREKDLVAALPYPHPAAVVLQLRAGLGVSAKADVLSYVLTSATRGDTWASVSAIAEALAYTSAGVRRAVDELAEAGFIVPAGSAARHTPAPRMYRANSGPWGTILGHAILSSWARWDQHFGFAAALIGWCRASAGREVSEYAFEAKLHELLSAYPLAFLNESAERERIPEKSDGTVAYFEARLGRWDGSLERNG